MTTRSEANTPLVIAHRGASRQYAENTVAALRGAAELGADWVEFDVRACADGSLVVHHDPELVPRARVHDGSVADALHPICLLDRRELPGAVPDLAAALAASEHLGVNVEIKELPNEPGFDPQRRIADPVVEAIVATGRPRRHFLVTSFDLAMIDRVRDLDPTIPTGLLSIDLAPDRQDRLVGLVASRGHVALNPLDQLTGQDLVHAAHGAGLAVNVWTVDEPARMRELASMGVDGIITNVPDVCRQALKV